MSKLKITEEDIKKEDVPRGEKTIYEIQRTKGKVAIVIKKGKLSKRKEWIDFKLEGTWRRYFPNRFIKQTITWKDWRGRVKTFIRYLVRFNLYYSEALGATKEIPEYDQALENQLLNAWGEQYKKAIGIISGLIGALARDRSIQLLFLFAGVAGIPIGMALWPNVISSPPTIIHWVPRR